jgi:hypothetical protein
MIHDKLTEFANAVSVAAAAGTAVIGNQIDLGGAGRDPGHGRPVYLIITVDTSIITGGSAGTIKFELVSDSVATLDNSPTIHLDTGTFVTDDVALAEVLAGDKLVYAVPLEGKVYERYLGIRAVIATTTVTAGAISAFLSLDQHGNKAYPDSANIGAV